MNLTVTAIPFSLLLEQNRMVEVKEDSVLEIFKKLLILGTPCDRNILINVQPTF